MKLKAIIRGGKVYEVGYRFFLFTKALELGCQGFFARNQSDGIKQLVLALIEGDQQQLAEFKEYAQAAKPEGSNVEDIAFEDYSGSIMSIDTFMHYFTADQLNKGIPALLRIDSKQDKMLEKQDRMLEKQDRMLEKQDDAIAKLEEVRSDIVLEIRTSREEVVAKLDENREAIVGEIREKKESLDERLKRIESDISLLKLKVGI
jgi:acylphosphatase